MAHTPSDRPSFSRSRRWSIAFNVTLATLGVLAVTVMLNYLAGRHFKRFYLSSDTKLQLSPRTLSVLNSLTNTVNVTLYYQSDDENYGALVNLLKEYEANSPWLKVRFVDYIRNSGAAQEMRSKYNLGAATNVIIFACEGRQPQFVSGDSLIISELERLPSEQEGALRFRRKPIAFAGETRFTAAVLAAVNPTPLKAYILQGDGGHAADNTPMGYSKFLTILQENYISVAPLWLWGTNAVPADCNLLVIAGPRAAMLPGDLESIDRYLSGGGRMLALFNVLSTNSPVGLEKVLARWGVNVSRTVVSDPTSYGAEGKGSDVIVFNFSKHPSVNALTGRKVVMVLPRMISKLEGSTAGSDARKVDEVMFTAPGAMPVVPDRRREEGLPLMTAVERGTEHGPARILVAGDSIFLSNEWIEMASNRDFVSFAANWLLERDTFLNEIGPQKLVEYGVLVSQSEMQSLQRILLGAIPGGVLLFGGLIWFIRRK